MLKKSLKAIEKAGRTIMHKIADRHGYQITKKTDEKARVYLHEYTSYEEYRAIQIQHNKRKIDRVWADEETLGLVASRVNAHFKNASKNSLFGLCHGSRNGFEQRVLAEKIDNIQQIIGTDISDTATNFPNSVEWDFHDINEEWVNRCHMIYTNSLDQSWKPQQALSTWLDQLVEGGLLFLEHTDAHTAQGASAMDPFGAEPQIMPYLLAEWFGHKIAIDFEETSKTVRHKQSSGEEVDLTFKVWLFVVKKLRE